MTLPQTPVDALRSEVGFPYAPRRHHRPGFRQRVIATTVTTPSDSDVHNTNYVGGIFIGGPTGSADSSARARHPYSTAATPEYPELDSESGAFLYDHAQRSAETLERPVWSRRSPRFRRGDGGAD